MRRRIFTRKANSAGSNGSRTSGCSSAKVLSRNRCPVRAAALSYTTLLALIPLLAVAISVTSSLLKSEGEQKIYEAIDKLVANVMPPARLDTNGPADSLNLSPAMSVALAQTHSESAGTPTNSAAGPANQIPQSGTPAADNSTRIMTAQKEAAAYIHDFVQNTRSGALGVTGMVLLVFIAIRMLVGIEATFNDIWGVTRGRNWLWRTVLYWTTITLGPLLLIAALGLAGGPHLQAAKNLINHMPLIGGFIFDLLPLVVLWLAFALAYLLVPNTRVHFGAALVGGIVGGSLWHLNNVFGFLYVSRVVTNSKIYGSLGLIPVFMVGPVFFLADSALWRTGRLRLPKPPDLFAGQARRKREPARTRIHRFEIDDVYRAMLPGRPASRHVAGDFP